MSDKDRKNPHEIKQDHDHHDPLERLTRIFNPNTQSENQNDQSPLQIDQSMSQSPETSSHDDFDLSFLETKLQNDLANDLIFDNQKEQWNLQAASSEQTSDITSNSSFNSLEKNNFFSEEEFLSLNHDEEKILDALSPLPIQKSPPPQKSAVLTKTDHFFEKSDLSVQSEGFFFDSDDRDNKKISPEPIVQANRFSQPTPQQGDVGNVQQNYGNKQNFYDISLQHPSHVSDAQDNQRKEYNTDVFLTSTNENVSFPSSDIISKREKTEKNEIISDFSSSLDLPQMSAKSDLKSFPQENHTTNYFQPYEEKSLQAETDTEEALKHHGAQEYINNTEDIPEQNNNNKEGLYSQSNLNAISASSEAFKTKKTDNFFAHNYTYGNTPPPNVDTYKFAEEIVEKTGPIMVPKVPYEAPEYDVPTDGLKEEFADVLNVGNVSEESFSQQQQQNEVLNEIFHQTMQSPREGPYTNSQIQNTNYFPADNTDYHSSSSENPPYRGVDEVPVHASVTSPLKSFTVSKILTRSVLLLILMAIGFLGYSHFLIRSQENESVPIIHADNTPFKIKQETTETKNDIAHNLDIYKQKTEQNEKQENTQQFLIDNSEQPEDLPEVNQQESTNSSFSSPAESDVEDAVTGAINHTIPTREVQTVIVNQDGTIVLEPRSHIEEKASDEPEQTIHQTPRDQFQGSPSVSSHASSPNNRETEDNLTSEIDKIIAENASTSHIEEKFVPLPSHSERNSERQTHIASRPTFPNPAITQNSENYYVQLASQPTHALASDSLKKIKSRFGSLIGVRPLNIQSALIPGKGTYYRVRIQTKNRNDATNLCESIKNSGGNCFITR